MIAYPNQIDNDTYLLEASPALNMTQGLDFFNTVWNAIVISAVRELEELDKPVDKTR